MENSCKYCNLPVADLTNESLKCDTCDNYVHISCLKRGSTPGALSGDIFFKFTCLECSDTDLEIFTRENQKWFYVLILTFYHLNVQHKGLSRRGFYHWKMHGATFIDKNWDTLFDKHVKQKKNWTGSVSGLLSIYNNTYFSKCTLFKEQGWWALKYPKLTPNVLVKLDTELRMLKSTLKSQNKLLQSEAELLDELIKSKNYPDEYLTTLNDFVSYSDTVTDSLNSFVEPQISTVKLFKQKRSLDTISGNSEIFLDGTPMKKKQKLEGIQFDETPSSSSQESTDSSKSSEKEEEISRVKFLDPLCHYNTSLNNIYTLKGMTLKTKLIGGLREEPILSPYTHLYLKPFIHRDTQSLPHWLKLMSQIKLKANENVDGYVLPSRGPIDYVYVQPSHIPAINSLCNQFFWPGIDLTECLQYPDFSCVVMYRKLIVGFAFIVPDVKIHENYISFVFVRPGWRNIGIAKFMLYHLIQTSMGKDITLHVAINSPGLFLYQKFGFKVEHVELNFYEKYLPSDSYESKHAFFCRLER